MNRRMGCHCIQPLYIHFISFSVDYLQEQFDVETSKKYNFGKYMFDAEKGDMDGLKEQKKVIFRYMHIYIGLMEAHSHWHRNMVRMGGYRKL